MGTVLLKPSGILGFKLGLLTVCPRARTEGWVCRCAFGTTCALGDGFMWHSFTDMGAEAQRMWLQVNLQVSLGCLVHEKDLPQQQCCAALPHCAGEE